MKLNAILEIVHQAYPDEHTRRCWNDKKQKPQTGTGDTLAEFIVREIVDTFDVDAGDKNQIDAALCAMRWASVELGAVIKALEKSKDSYSEQESVTASWRRQRIWPKQK